jgi:two-component system, LytTR family, response regulator
MKTHKPFNHQGALYIQAAESYSIVFQLVGKPLIKSRPLKKYANFLIENGWCRIHRSYLVNPNFVSSITECRTNICLQNGEILPISRRNLKAVLQWRNNTKTINY